MKIKYKKMFNDFKRTLQENSDLCVKQKTKEKKIQNLKNNIESLEDIVKYQKNQILKLKKSETELSYFKSNVKFNSTIISNDL